MIKNFYFYQNPDNNPHNTLALEEYMVMNVGPEDMILYLYTHGDTVVIGRNQNAWSECRHQRLFDDGGTLARRISGGGAVFHDIGNLNFSFVTAKENYDLHRQLSVILNAVKTLGVDAEFSGRNDILAGGRKFSGNAFCFKKNGAFHHGTVLINSDMQKLSQYLAVPKDKIESKGIASVRSRVINLSEINPDITNGAVALAMRLSFEDEYGPAVPYPLTPEVKSAVARIAERNASWDWQFGQSPAFDISITHRFDWGGVDIQLSLKDAVIEKARIFSDAMDADIIEDIAGHLVGVSFNSPALSGAVRSTPHTGEQAALIGSLAGYIDGQNY